MYDFKAKTPSFYDDNYVPQTKNIMSQDVDLNNPQDIYRFIKQNVYKQDEYCKLAAMFLYNHARGIRSRMVVAGPPGSGKSLVSECIKALWPNTIIVNAATLTMQGFVGNNKVDSCLKRINTAETNYILVYDEFDKIVRPRRSANENVSDNIQAEFLKMVEGETIDVGEKGETHLIDTSKMSFIFCGSFAVKANEIAEKNSYKTMGFNAEEHVEKAFAKELTMDDIIDFGLIPEIASRCTNLANVRPLTLKDYEYLLTEHPASPLRKIEDEYQVKIHITKKKLKQIAREAYNSQLGVRYAYAKLRRMVDAEIFNSYEKSDDEMAFIYL